LKKYINILATYDLKMKIGINLSGVSYETHHRNRNFEESLDSFNKYIVEPLLNDNHNIKFYIYTYETIKTEEVKKSYQPLCKYKFIDEVTQNILPNFTEQGHNLYNGLLDMVDEDLDIVIRARFDQKFNYNPLTYYKWDFNKAVFLWREPLRTDLPLLNDTFFTFPYYMLNDVIQSIYDLEVNPAHGVKYSLHNMYIPLTNRVGTENVMWVDNEFRTKEMNNLYTLTRRD